MLPFINSASYVEDGCMDAVLHIPMFILIVIITDFDFCLIHCIPPPGTGMTLNFYFIFSINRRRTSTGHTSY
jgi:hypothetical protein